MRKALGFLLLAVACSMGLSASAEFLELRPPQYGMGCYEQHNGWRTGGPGTIGVSCKASVMGDANRAVAIYQSFLMDGEKILNPNYQNDYTARTVSLIEQIAVDFYLKRAAEHNRTVKPEELSAWVNTVVSTATLESTLTHYQLRRQPINGNLSDSERLNILVGDARCTDEMVMIKGELKLVRSAKDENGKCIGKAIFDTGGKRVYGSKGMFQFLLGSHDEKNFFDLTINILEGVDYLFGFWSNALNFPDKPNIGGAINRCRAHILAGKNGKEYERAARAAYSGHNGGPNGICRFFKYLLDKNGKPTEVSSHKHDQNYLKRLREKPWLKYFNNAERVKTKKMVKIGDRPAEARYTFDFDLDCARKGHDLCIVPKADMQAYNRYIDGRISNRLFVATLPEERGNTFCAWDKAKNGFVCTPKEENVPCLQGMTGFARKNAGPKQAYYELYKIDLEDRASVVESRTDRQQLCKTSNRQIATSGTIIRLLKNSPVYVKPQFKVGSVGLFKPGALVQVLNFEINPKTGFDRWYRVAVTNSKDEIKEGYVYGGDEIDHQQFVEIVDISQANGTERYIPVAGDLIRLRKNFCAFAPYAGVDPDESSDNKKCPEDSAGEYFAGQQLLVKSVEYLGEDEEIVLTVQNGAYQLQDSKVSKEDAENPEFSVQIQAGQIKTNKGELAKYLSDILEVIGRKAGQ